MQTIATRKDPSVLLRVPKPILKSLDAAAAKNGRSRNSEVLVRLSESLGLTPAPAKAGA